MTIPGSGTPHSIRLETYLACMAEAGLTDLVQVARRDVPRGGRAAGPRWSCSRRPTRPTAIFAAHDDLAIGALAGVADAGHGRGEVSVVGYDNTDLAAHPLIDLTSVDQQGEEMGEQAVTDAARAPPGADRAPGLRRDPQPRRSARSTGPLLGASSRRDTDLKRSNPPDRRRFRIIPASGVDESDGRHLTSRCTN